MIFKYSMDGTWKRGVRRSSFFERFPCLFKTWSTFSASCAGKKDTGSGSFGEEPTSAHYVLFRVEGMHPYLRSNLSLISTPRISIASSRVTAKIVSEIVTWSGVTMRFYVPRIVV